MHDLVYCNLSRIIIVVIICITVMRTYNYYINCNYFGKLLLFSYVYPIFYFLKKMFIL